MQLGSQSDINTVNICIYIYVYIVYIYSIYIYSIYIVCSVIICNVGMTVENVELTLSIHTLHAHGAHNLLMNQVPQLFG